MASGSSSVEVWVSKVLFLFPEFFWGCTETWLCKWKGLGLPMLSTCFFSCLLFIWFSNVWRLRRVYFIFMVNWRTGGGESRIDSRGVKSRPLWGYRLWDGCVSHRKACKGRNASFNPLHPKTRMHILLIIVL